MRRFYNIFSELPGLPGRDLKHDLRIPHTDVYACLNTGTASEKIKEKKEAAGRKILKKKQDRSIV